MIVLTAIVCGTDNWKEVLHDVLFCKASVTADRQTLFPYYSVDNEALHNTPALGTNCSKIAESNDIIGRK